MERLLDRGSRSRRRFLASAGAATLALGPLRALAAPTITLPLPGGPDERLVTTDFPEKGALILQRTRPPLLETPFEVFDQGVFTPNDRFFVRWHWAVIPAAIDVKDFVLAGSSATSSSRRRSPWPEEDPMLHRVLPIAFLSMVALAPLGAKADGNLVLKSVNVDMPFGDRMFPDGPGADAINSSCLSCHSAGMVLNQPALPKAQWRAEVEKMRNAYKAPIDPKDVDVIVDYLARTKGTE
jgi:hypothetical protein